MSSDEPSEKSASGADKKPSGDGSASKTIPILINQRTTSDLDSSMDKSSKNQSWASNYLQSIGLSYDKSIFKRKNKINTSKDNPNSFLTQDSNDSIGADVNVPNANYNNVTNPSSSTLEINANFANQNDIAPASETGATMPAVTYATPYINDNNYYYSQSMKGVEISQAPLVYHDPTVNYPYISPFGHPTNILENYANYYTNQSSNFLHSNLSGTYPGSYYYGQMINYSTENNMSSINPCDIDRNSTIVADANLDHLKPKTSYNTLLNTNSSTNLNQSKENNLCDTKTNTQKDDRKCCNCLCSKSKHDEKQNKNDENKSSGTSKHESRVMANERKFRDFLLKLNMKQQFEQEKNQDITKEKSTTKNHTENRKRKDVEYKKDADERPKFIVKEKSTTINHTEKQKRKDVEYKKDADERPKFIKTKYVDEQEPEYTPAKKAKIDNNPKNTKYINPEYKSVKKTKYEKYETTKTEAKMYKSKVYKIEKELPKRKNIRYESSQKIEKSKTESTKYYKYRTGNRKETSKSSPIKNFVKISKKRELQTSSQNSSDNEDLRDILSRKINEKNTILKTKNREHDMYKKKSAEDLNDNLIITVNNNISEIEKAPEKPDDKTKAKNESRKKINLVINIVYKQSSSESESDKSENDDQQVNADLSFLDDINVDEIVESLNKVENDGIPKKSSNTEHNISNVLIKKEDTDTGFSKAMTLLDKENLINIICTEENSLNLRFTKTDGDFKKEAEHTLENIRTESFSEDLSNDTNKVTEYNTDFSMTNYRHKSEDKIQLFDHIIDVSKETSNANSSSENSSKNNFYHNIIAEGIIIEHPSVFRSVFEEKKINESSIIDLSNDDKNIMPLSKMKTAAKEQHLNIPTKQNFGDINNIIDLSNDDTDDKMQALEMKTHEKDLNMATTANIGDIINIIKYISNKHFKDTIDLTIDEKTIENEVISAIRDHKLKTTTKSSSVDDDEIIFVSETKNNTFTTEKTITEAKDTEKLSPEINEVCNEVLYTRKTDAMKGSALNTTLYIANKDRVKPVHMSKNYSTINKEIIGYDLNGNASLFKDTENYHSLNIQDTLMKIEHVSPQIQKGVKPDAQYISKGNFASNVITEVTRTAQDYVSNTISSVEKDKAANSIKKISSVKDDSGINVKQKKKKEEEMHRKTNVSNDIINKNDNVTIKDNNKVIPSYTGKEFNNFTQSSLKKNKTSETVQSFRVGDKSKGDSVKTMKFKDSNTHSPFVKKINTCASSIFKKDEPNKIVDSVIPISDTTMTKSSSSILKTEVVNNMKVSYNSSTIPTSVIKRNETILPILKKEEINTAVNSIGEVIEVIPSSANIINKYFITSTQKKAETNRGIVTVSIEDHTKLIPPITKIDIFSSTSIEHIKQAVGSMITGDNPKVMASAPKMNDSLSSAFNKDEPYSVKVKYDTKMIPTSVKNVGPPAKKIKLSPELKDAVTRKAIDIIATKAKDDSKMISPPATSILKKNETNKMVASVKSQDNSRMISSPASKINESPSPALKKDETNKVVDSVKTDATNIVTSATKNYESPALKKNETNKIIASVKTRDNSRMISSPAAKINESPSPALKKDETNKVAVSVKMDATKIVTYPATKVHESLALKKDETKKAIDNVKTSDDSKIVPSVAKINESLALKKDKTNKLAFIVKTDATKIVSSPATNVNESLALKKDETKKAIDNVKARDDSKVVSSPAIKINQSPSPVINKNETTKVVDSVKTSDDSQLISSSATKIKESSSATIKKNETIKAVDSVKTPDDSKVISSPATKTNLSPSPTLRRDESKKAVNNVRTDNVKTEADSKVVSSPATKINQSPSAAKKKNETNKVVDSVKTLNGSKVISSSATKTNESPSSALKKDETNKVVDCVKTPNNSKVISSPATKTNESPSSALKKDETKKVVDSVKTPNNSKVISSPATKTNESPSSALKKDETKKVVDSVKTPNGSKVISSPATKTNESPSSALKKDETKKVVDSVKTTNDSKVISSPATKTNESPSSAMKKDEKKKVVDSVKTKKDFKVISSPATKTNESPSSALKKDETKKVVDSVKTTNDSKVISSPATKTNESPSSAIKKDETKTVVDSVKTPNDSKVISSPATKTNESPSSAMKKDEKKKVVDSVKTKNDFKVISSPATKTNESPSSALKKDETKKVVDSVKTTNDSKVISSPATKTNESPSSALKKDETKKVVDRVKTTNDSKVISSPATKTNESPSSAIKKDETKTVVDSVKTPNDSKVISSPATKTNESPSSAMKKDEKKKVVDSVKTKNDFKVISSPATKTNKSPSSALKKDETKKVVDSVKTTNDSKVISSPATKTNESPSSALKKDETKKVVDSVKTTNDSKVISSPATKTNESPSSAMKKDEKKKVVDSVKTKNDFKVISSPATKTNKSPSSALKKDETKKVVDSVKTTNDSKVISSPATKTNESPSSALKKDETKKVVDSVKTTNDSKVISSPATKTNESPSSAIKKDETKKVVDSVKTTNDSKVISSPATKTNESPSSAIKKDETKKVVDSVKTTNDSKVISSPATKTNKSPSPALKKDETKVVDSVKTSNDSKVISSPATKTNESPSSALKKDETKKVVDSVKTTNDSKVISSTATKINQSPTLKKDKPSKKANSIRDAKLVPSSPATKMNSSPSTLKTNVATNSFDISISHIAGNLERVLQKCFNQTFTVISLINSGTYSKIFRCRNTEGRDYAVKSLNGINSVYNAADKRDMLFELQRGIIKNNYTCVYLLKSFSLSSHLCYFMDYYPKNLKQALQEKGQPFHINVVQSLACQLVSAVMLLKIHNIVHLDIKPSHILLNNACNTLKLCGFDAARNGHNVPIMPNLGTINYRAPEIIMGYKIGFDVDVWATGLVLYEMATNEKLFPGTHNNDILFKQMCTLGPLPIEMIHRSRYGLQHFTGSNFIRLAHDRKPINIVTKFRKSERIKNTITRTYKNWTWNASTQFQLVDKYMLFTSLIHNMLEVDPTDRMPIQFVNAHPFITDEFS